MITIYNKSNRSTYSAYLRRWNDTECCYDQDILEEIDTDLAEKWDPMLGLYVMDQYELDYWMDFWNDEIENAKIGLSSLLDEGEYVFYC